MQIKITNQKYIYYVYIVKVPKVQKKAIILRLSLGNPWVILWCGVYFELYLY